MNLPNKLTLLRVCMIPFFVVFARMGAFWAQCVAVGIYALACITDTLDGHIARSRNLITDFGKFMDPIADKLLVMSALVVLTAQGRMPDWVCILMLAREFLVSGFRLVAVENGRVIAAGPLGKLKTEGEEDETTVTTFVPYKISGTEVYYSGGIVIETVGEMQDENSDGEIDEKDILTQAQYRLKYGYDNTLSGKVEKYLNGQSDHGVNVAISETFSAKGFDNKNQFEYSTSFANRQHGDLSFARPWKTKVYRAYTYLRDYDGSAATASNLKWDNQPVTSETEISSITSHSGALIKVSMPV